MEPWLNLERVGNFLISLPILIFSGFLTIFTIFFGDLKSILDKYDIREEYSSDKDERYEKEKDSL